MASGLRPSFDRPAGCARTTPRCTGRRMTADRPQSHGVRHVQVDRRPARVGHRGEGEGQGPGSALPGPGGGELGEETIQDGQALLVATATLTKAEKTGGRNRVT